MKTKFVNVWDYCKMGRVKFIVLQVEKTDTFFTEAGFNPGYKFIIQALYHYVGATGGHTFIPAYGENARETSRKMNTVEGDVLGFYLSYVTDINDIPDELFTENFWNVANGSSFEGEEKREYDTEEYYKALLWRHYDKSYLEYNSVLAKKFNFTEKYAEEDSVSGLVKYRDHLEIAYINRQTLKIESSQWSTDLKSMIAQYNWLPNDEISDEEWEAVKERLRNSWEEEDFRYALYENLFRP